MQTNPSLGKQIWLKYFRWIVVAIVLALGVFGFFLYNKGTKDTLAKLPQSVPYPPTTGIPSQDKAQVNWVDTKGTAIVLKLGNYLREWHLTNIGINTIIVNDLRPLADWQLVYINEAYNRNYFTQGKGSLVKDLLDITYVGLDGVRNDIVIRLQKLGAK
jgi:hypothetical protein